MVYVPPPDRGSAKSSSGSPRLETQEEQTPKTKRKRGKRGTSVSKTIDTTARKRHRAWLARELNAVESCTTDLEGLYVEHRGEQAGTFTDPYRGRTWRPQ